MAVHGTRNRESVSWDYAGVLQVLGNVARDHTGLPLLRCYWYEATVEGRRSSEHEILADLPGVKLRLGKMKPGRREGVESEIHRDLTTLARNRAISDALVVSAEEDLAQVIADVQDLGLRVILVHIAAPGWTAATALRQECDEIVEISEAHLRPSVELVVGAEPVSEDERQAVPAYASRAPANGHGTPGVIGQPALPAGSHAAPPALYTGPVIAEYQRAAQPANSHRPPLADAPGPAAAGNHSLAAAARAAAGDGAAGCGGPARHGTGRHARPARHLRPAGPAAGAAGPGGPGASGPAARPGSAAAPSALAGAPALPSHDAPPGYHAAPPGHHAAPGHHVAGPPQHAAPGQPMMPPGQPRSRRASQRQATQRHTSPGRLPPRHRPHRRSTRSCCRAAAGSTRACRRRIQSPGPRPASTPLPPQQFTTGQPMAGPVMPGQPVPGQPGAPAAAPGFQAPAGLPGSPAPQARQGMPAYQAAPPPPPPAPAPVHPAALAPSAAPPGFPGQAADVAPGQAPAVPRPPTAGAPPGPALAPPPGAAPAGPVVHPGQQLRGAPGGYPAALPGRPPGAAGDQRARQFPVPGRPPGQPGPYVPPQGPHSGPQPAAQHALVPQPVAVSLADAVQAAHGRGLQLRPGRRQGRACALAGGRARPQAADAFRPRSQAVAGFLAAH